MLRVPFFLLIACCCFLIFSACGSSPPPSSGSGGNSGNSSGASPAEAQAAAQAALNRMDGGGQPAASGTPSSSNQTEAAPSSSAPSAPQGTTVNTSKTRPAWVDSVDSAFNRNQYVAAVGNASDRTMAEKNSLANLTRIFGQSIRADQTITNTYQEAVRNGLTTGWTDSIAMQNTVTSSASMDTLVGAEVREVWYDSRNTWYAVAVMEKARTTQLYTEMINANQNMINNLITMNQTEKNSLEGFSRYQFAAAVADINMSYGNLLQVIGAPLPEGLVKGDIYRLEAQNITKAIPVGIAVRNDKAGRIQGAFAKSLSELGFRSGGNNSRYVLDVNVVTSPVEYPNNPNKFVRIELSANLTDTLPKAVLLPYNFNNREGHSTQAEAENRTYMLAERQINDEYPKLLSDYLSRLLPQKR
jgi:hypothetical protein